MNSMERAHEISQFLAFLKEMREILTTSKVASNTPAVEQIRSSVEDHYTDEDGKPAVYLSMDSALYDDAPAIVNLWNRLGTYDPDQLRRYRRLIGIELAGLNGDRHPRKIFDRSPLGVAALIVGTVTVWMTFLKMYSGEDLSELLELIRFNSIVGVIWIVGLFVVVWYILRIHRNNVQVAHLATVARAIDLMID